MKEIKETQEIYNDYYTNVLIPYITKKIDIYALPYEDEAYQILFRFNINTLYEFLEYIEKPDYSIMRKLLEKSINRDLMYHTIEKTIQYKKEIGSEFHRKTAPEIMEKYDGVLRVLDMLPIEMCSRDKKFALLEIETLGDLHRALLHGNKECQIELVDDIELRQQYQDIYQMILEGKELKCQEPELSQKVMIRMSHDKKIGK